MNLYDAHTHLNEEKMFSEWKHYVDLFVQAGGRGLVNSGASEFFNSKGIEIAKLAGSLKPEAGSQVTVKCTVGYHPGECGGEAGASGHTETITPENIQEKMNELRKLYEENKKYIVAIGECGIDVHYPGSQEKLKVQKKLFIMHCDLAQELHLPLVVHSRDDFETTMDILRTYRNITVYFHCRGYGPKEMESLIAESENLHRKLFIGFCGNITYKNAQSLRDSLDKVPLDRLIMETDAPWLSPQAVRGTMNHPANVKYIYEFVAQQRGVDLDQLCEIIEKNYKTLYRIQ